MQTVSITRLACAMCSVVFTPDVVLAQTSGADAGGPHMSLWGEDWYAMWPGPLLMVLLLALLIMILIRETAPRNRNVEPAPMEILEERFARGEIDEEEFERRRRVIRR